MSRHFCDIGFRVRPRLPPCSCLGAKSLVISCLSDTSGEPLIVIIHFYTDTIQYPYHPDADPPRFPKDVSPSGDVLTRKIDTFWVVHLIHNLTLCTFTFTPKSILAEFCANIEFPRRSTYLWKSHATSRSSQFHTAPITLQPQRKREIWPLWKRCHLCILL